MSSEAVKRQLLISVTALNLPLTSVPSSKKVSEACSAAKLLRNRLLREHARVVEYVGTLRQRQIYDDNIDDDEDDVDEMEMNDSKGARSEFIFLAELQIVEKLVVPLLLAHGMKFSESLLPQLLKLLTAVMQPVPRFSVNETLQLDLLQRIKARCGSDEFFSLLVQSVAPIAEKRELGSLHREDVVLLEVVLTLMTHLLEGRSQGVESIIGAFCRNHGIELLLVVINQNYAKEQKLTEKAAITEQLQNMQTSVENNDLGPTPIDHHCGPVERENTTLGNEEKGPTPEDVVLSVEASESSAEEELSGSESGSEDVENQDRYTDEYATHLITDDIQKQFEEKVLDLLEGEDQLWKWNCLAMKSLASVLGAVYPTELAQLNFLGQANVASADQLLTLLRSGSQFRDCKKESDNWRFVARSRNGAMNSNSVLVRLDPGNRSGTVGARAIGTVSSLLGTRRKDSLDNVKDMDLKKRGRFVKGMFQDSAPRCDLPLPTKILLSQQVQSFLCLGFERLSSMVWARLLQISSEVERASKEFKEMVAGFKNSGEQMEITSPLTAELYQAFSSVLDYVGMCSSLLHYVRELARLMEENKIDFTQAAFVQQWQSVSSIISLDHLESGFAVLRSFLQCKDLRKRCDILTVVKYLAETLFLLNLVLERKMVNDAAVDVAAHALASSVLYKEENIKTVFDLLTEYSVRNLSVPKSQSLTLFVFAVFQLMERCSFNGSLLLPKRPKRKANQAEAGEEGSDMDDEESINSAELEQIEMQMAEEMADMIDDGESDHSVAKNGVQGKDERSSQLSAAESAPGNAAEQENSEKTEILDSTPGARPRSSEECQGAAVVTPSRDEEPEIKDLQPTSTGEADASRAQQTSANEEESENDVRPASEAHPPSIGSLASSGRTSFSAISSEREVAVSTYIRRLATPKNSSLLYAALRHWRINDADVNLGLTYLMERLVKDGCGNIFFSLSFLLLFRDIIVHGERSHEPLYAVCDQLVYNFFNPSLAHSLDARARDLFENGEANTLSGPQSFLGFDVALRCARSLFSFTSADYDVLEEKAMPHLMDYTVIPLPSQSSDQNVVNDHLMGAEGASYEGVLAEMQTGTAGPPIGAVADCEDGGPARKKSRHSKKHEKVKKGRERKGKHSHHSENPPTESPLDSAAAAEEERVFQELMAAITPAPGADFTKAVNESETAVQL